MSSSRLSVPVLCSVVVTLLAACEPPSVVTPLAPSIRLDNAGPSSARSVVVLGSAPTDSTIEVFADGQCASLPLVTATAAELATGVRVDAAPNTTTYFSARATLNGVFSGCSAPAVYVQDEVAPGVPSLVSVTGLGGLPPHVKVEGLAEAGVKVRVFTNAQCQAPGTDVRADDGHFSLELEVAANAETRFTAQALDAAGNASGCSAPPLRFVHDQLAPQPPHFTSITPMGPSQVAVPTVAGDAEAGSSVRFFFDAACSSSPAGSTTADASGHFTAQVAMQLNTLNRLYAVALDASANRSSCAGPLLYEHDDTPPEVFFNGTTPASPSRTATSFTVNVSTSEPGSTVALFATADCSGAPASSLVSVTPNVPVTVSARATDVVGNVSGCVTGPTLLNDTLAPAAPSITGSMPVSPSRTSQYPVLSGTADASGALKLFRTADCTGTATSYTVSASGQFTASTSVTANSTTTFTANVTDLAGNVSACSAPFTFTHDNRAPAVATLWGTLPPSPSSVTALRVLGAAEAGAQVLVFANTVCTGVAAATATAGTAINTSGQGSFSAPLTVAAGTTSSFVVMVQDAAGNSSPCSAPISFVHSTTRGWGDDEALGFSSGQHSWPEVTLTPGGDAVALFGRMQASPMGVFRVERTASGAWGTPTLLTDPADTAPVMTSQPRVVSDASGVVLMGFTAHGQAMLARRAADASWTTQSLSGTDYGRAPDVALDGSGNGVAVIERFVTSTTRVFARRSTGASWGAEALISDPNFSCFEPRAAMAPGGRAVITFARNTGSGLSPRDELWSTTGEAATAFPAATQRSAVGAYFDRRNVRLGMTGTGEATAVWLASAQNLGPYMPTTSATTNGTWGTVINLSSTTTTSQEFDLKVLPTGEAMAVWAGFTLSFSRKLTGSSVWSAPTTIVGATYPGGVRLAADSTGRFVAVWKTVDAYGGGGQLWFSVFAANAWSAPQLLDVGVGTNDGFSLALDAQGRAVAAWSKAQGTDFVLRTRALR
ncbi:MAG: Ig-like domain-containing protein [Myxococcaceae bacterium]